MRRSTLLPLAVALAACGTTNPPAAATPEELAVVLRELFGDRAITRGRVKLDIPRLAENGSIVPVIVSVDSPMTEQDYVKRIHLFAEATKVAYFVRDEHIADPAQVDVDVAGFLSDAWADAARAKIRMDRAMPGPDWNGGTEHTGDDHRLLGADRRGRGPRERKRNRQ